MSIVFKRAGFERQLRIVTDGVSAIDYLCGHGPYRDRTQYPMPEAVLLDLNMPGKDGFEVLAWIRLQPNLSQVRVYVLSSSNRLDDIARCRELGAHAYLVKPRTLDGLDHLARTLVAWLNLNQFESRSDLRSHAASQTPIRRTGTGA